MSANLGPNIQKKNICLVYQTRAGLSINNDFLLEQFPIRFFNKIMLMSLETKYFCAS